MSAETQPPDGSAEDMSADSGTEDKLSSSVTLVRENISKPALATDNCKTTRDCSSSTTSASTSAKKDKKKDIFSNLPNFDTQDWYSHKCFDRYWSHYGYVMNWYKKHGHVQRSLQKKLSYHRSYPSYQAAYSYPSFSYQPYSYPYSHPYSHAQYTHGQTSVRSRRGRGRGRANCAVSGTLSQRSVPLKRKQGDIDMDVESDFADAVEVGDDDVACDVTPAGGEDVASQMEMEISDEMLDFLQHLKNTGNREAEKKEDIAKEKKDKRINIEDVRGQPRERTSEAPSERPGLRRTSEMKLLYGTGAAMIHGMETALQMTYDRHLDANQPKYWPNMPLRVHFSDSS